MNTNLFFCCLVEIQLIVSIVPTEIYVFSKTLFDEMSGYIVCQCLYWLQNWLTSGDQQEDDPVDSTSPQIVELEEDKSTDEIDVCSAPLDEPSTESLLSDVHTPLGSDKHKATDGFEPDFHGNQNKIDNKGKILTQWNAFNVRLQWYFTGWRWKSWTKSWMHGCTIWPSKMAIRLVGLI